MLCQAAAAKKAAKGKKAKDPNKPKRTLSSYMLWMGEVGRAAAKAAHPDAKTTEISKYAGEMWRNMSDAEKQVYKDKAEALKQEAAANAPVRGWVCGSWVGIRIRIGSSRSPSCTGSFTVSAIACSCGRLLLLPLLY